MKHHHETETLRLPMRAIHRIEDGNGLQVACLTGHTWITQAHDMRDIVLSAGESFVLDRDGVALVMALDDALITVAPARTPELLAA
jgi:hypothetical protein